MTVKHYEATKTCCDAVELNIGSDLRCPCCGYMASKLNPQMLEDMYREGRSNAKPPSPCFLERQTMAPQVRGQRVARATGTTFYLYGQHQHIKLIDLVQHGAEEGDLLVTAGESGCESSYVEVARWCEKRMKYFRYAFLKVMDTCLYDSETAGEDNLDGYIEADDWEKAAWVAAQIPSECPATMVHGLDDWWSAEDHNGELNDRG